MSNTFTFAGVNSGTMHLLCSHGGTYDAPERDVTVLAVPGRDGDLVVDNGRWRNVPVPYPCYVQRGFADSVPQIRAWLAGDGNYHRLEDDAHPGEYRMARLAGELGFAPRYLDHQAEVTVTFDCKPQRWLTSGEASIHMTEPGTLLNPTAFPARPLLTVACTGDGVLTVAGRSYALQDIPGSVTIDSERMDAYNGATPLNHMVEDYPVLPSGDCPISWSGGISAVTITPRWWTL